MEFKDTVKKYFLCAGLLAGGGIILTIVGNLLSKMQWYSGILKAIKFSATITTMFFILFLVLAFIKHKKSKTEVLIK